ncbi:MAG TPA: malto-oligosyltrehalose trehalohydrolase [Rhodocyclaceae bacterium]|nr:malto-oligosyltrehalose trehalohydrolase [Rhodocyclaceae bacterium]
MKPGVEVKPMNLPHSRIEIPAPHRNLFHFDASFGAQYLPNGQTRFRLWGPSVTTAALKVNNHAAIPMQKLDGGWYELHAQIAPGSLYCYRVQPEGGEEMFNVPDPASRLQHNDVHDHSVVVDPASYAWQNTEWRGRPWHETVLYELHVGTCGGFKGVQARLKTLADLGITAVELMPIADFPGARNWGYDGVLPYAPDAAYGTPDELKALIDTAHGLGLMVFLDVVYNHFGPDGNDLGKYAQPFFRHDIKTPWGDAIDFREAPVRRFFIENALYWLQEYRFDGLRFDAMHAIHDQSFLPELAQEVQLALAPYRHVHLVLEHDGNVSPLLDGIYDAQWNDDGHHVLHVLLTGECHGYYCDYADNPIAKLARCLAEGFVFQGEISAHRGGVPRGHPSTALPPTAFVLFLQNHDQVGNRAFGERLTTLAHPAALRAAYALLLLSPQIPLLFMGEEIGATQPFLYFTSHVAPGLSEAVREGRRNEFASFPAFSDEATRALIPDPGDIATYNNSVVAAQATDPESSIWLSRIQVLLAVRHTEIVPRLPGCHSLGAEVIGTAAVLARWRMGDQSILTVIVNFADEHIALAADVFARTGSGRMIHATNGCADQFVQGRIPPHGFIALLE